MDQQPQNRVYLNNVNKLFSSQQVKEENSFIDSQSQVPQMHYSSQMENITNENKKSKHIFKIKKFHKYDEILDEICSEEDHSEDEKKDPVRKRVSAFSKVNFTKLKNEEKDERLQNLSKLVKRLRRKVKNLENKFKNNTNKLLTKFISHSLGISKKKKFSQEENNFTNNDLNNSTNNISNSNSSNNCSLEIDVDKICKALNNLRNYENFEYEDEKHIIENMINLIAEDKLPLDSINFRKICTQLRLFTSQEKINYISKKGQKITFSFPERDLNITAKEYEYYSNFKDREDVIRMILGISEQGGDINYPEKINFDQKNRVKEIIVNNKMEDNDRNENFADSNRYSNSIKLENLNLNNLFPLGIVPNYNNNTNQSSNNNNFQNNSVNPAQNNNTNNIPVQNLLLNSMYGNLYQNLFNENNKNI